MNVNKWNRWETSLNYHPCHIGLNRIFINQCPNVKILNDEKILDNLTNLEKKNLLCSKNKSVQSEEYYNCDTNQIKSMNIKSNQCKTALFIGIY